MSVKMATGLKFFVCDECDSLHVALFRDGELFAVAIPNDAEAALDEVTRAVMEIRARVVKPSGRGH